MERDLPCLQYLGNDQGPGQVTFSFRSTSLELLSSEPPLSNSVAKDKYHNLLYVNINWFLTRFAFHAAAGVWQRFKVLNVEYIVSFGGIGINCSSFLDNYIYSLWWLVMKTVGARATAPDVRVGRRTAGLTMDR